MNELSGYSGSHRYIGELSNLAKRISQHKLTYQNALFDTSLSQSKNQRLMNRDMFSQTMAVKRQGMQLNQSLFQKQLNAVPSWTESFVSSFVPGAVNSIGQSYLGNKQQDTFNQQLEYFKSLLNSINGVHNNYPPSQMLPSYGTPNVQVDYNWNPKLG